MGYDFFDELGDTISRTTKDLSKRAGQLYESQKIRNRLSSEEHMVEKLKCDIGNLIYQRYREGADTDEELHSLCREIEQHMKILSKYKDSAAELKGRKICPSCEKAVDRSVLFCPYCGAPCPTPEPEKAEGEAADESVEQEIPKPVEEEVKSE